MGEKIKDEIVSMSNGNPGTLSVLMRMMEKIRYNRIP